MITYTYSIVNGQLQIRSRALTLIEYEMKFV